MGGVCYTPEGGDAYLAGGVPKEGLLVVERSGIVRPFWEADKEWSNFGEVPVAEVFTKIQLM